ncbi:MAG: DUF1611 domain-containing protein [Actinomycetota bacterium]
MTPPTPVAAVPDPPDLPDPADRPDPPDRPRPGPPPAPAPATDATAPTTAAAAGPIVAVEATMPVPSAAFTIADPAIVHGYRPLAPGEPAAPGDVIVGEVVAVGEHTEIQNRNGRAHQLGPGQRGLFVFGNRYATDAFEALVPAVIPDEVDLVAKGGMVAVVNSANARVHTPTRVRVLGRAVDADHRPLSTLDQPIVAPRRGPKTEPRARLVLVVGTSMNAGKSTTAVAIARALTQAGHRVKGSKVTGTASLKEILHLEDAGACAVNDFTHLGHPSTHRLDADEVIGVFDALDHAIANRSDVYWVAELADGIEQRETAILLSSLAVTRRIHTLVFCAREPLGVRGGIDVLDDRYGLAPDLIAGLVGGAPLGQEEIRATGIDLPVINALDPDDYPLLVEVITRPPVTRQAAS